MIIFCAMSKKEPVFCPYAKYGKNEVENSKNYKISRKMDRLALRDNLMHVFYDLMAVRSKIAVLMVFHSAFLALNL